MGCRCAERRQAIGRAAGAVMQGRFGAAARQAAFVGRTLAGDVRSGALRASAQQQLARLRAGKR
jgi:hypothetical protein